MTEGWRAHPDAIDGDATLSPVRPGRVVGVGAICDLAPQRADERSLSFSVGEFVVLEDGRRVMLHQGRGFTLGGSDARETLDSLTRDVLNAVLPDDDECAEDHPWSWLAGLARARGLDVTADDLRGLPYEVVFTDAVRRWVA